MPSSLRSLARQQREQATALASAETAHDLALQRFRAGLGSYLLVLNTESQWRWPSAGWRGGPAGPPTRHPRGADQGARRRLARRHRQRGPGLAPGRRALTCRHLLPPLRI